MRGGRVFRSSSTVVRLSALSRCPLRRILGPPSRNFAAMTSPLNGLEFTGQSGTKYTVIKTLQEEKFPPRRVYLALDSRGEKAILKYIHEVNYSYLVDEIYGRLRNNTHYLRLYKDVIPGKSMFVFEHFTGHLLQLAQKRLPILTTKEILKQALLGIAEMHDQEIIHTGMFYHAYS
jgi:serine/threonine protein kinase